MTNLGFFESDTTINKNRMGLRGPAGEVGVLNLGDSRKVSEEKQANQGRWDNAEWDYICNTRMKGKLEGTVCLGTVFLLL